MLRDPAAGRELTDDALVEFPFGCVVDVLDAGAGESEFCLAQTPRNPCVLAAEVFGIDEEPEPFVKGYLLQLGFFCCSAQAAAKAVSFMASSFCMVGSFSTWFSIATSVDTRPPLAGGQDGGGSEAGSVVVAPAAHVFVLAQR